MLAKQEEESKVPSDWALAWDEGTPYEGLLKADIDEWFDLYGRQDKPDDEIGLIITRMIYIRIDKNLRNANRFAYIGQINYQSIAGEIRRSILLSPEEIDEYLEQLTVVWASLDIKFYSRYTAEYNSDLEADTTPDPADE